MASKGFSSARNVSLSGRMIVGGDGGLIAGSLMSLVHQWGRGTCGEGGPARRRAPALGPALPLPADAEHPDQRLRGPFRPAAAELPGIFFSDYHLNPPPPHPAGPTHLA